MRHFSICRKAFQHRPGERLHLQNNFSKVENERKALGTRTFRAFPFNLPEDWTAFGEVEVSSALVCDRRLASYPQRFAVAASHVATISVSSCKHQRSASVRPFHSELRPAPSVILRDFVFTNLHSGDEPHRYVPCRFCSWIEGIGVTLLQESGLGHNQLFQDGR